MSSYLHRVAELNMIPISTFYNENNRAQSIFGEVCKGKYEIAQTLFGLDAIAAKNCTLNRFEGIWFPYGDNVYKHLHNNRWIGGTRIRICPICLKNTHYNKLHWKLKISFLCEKHGILLLDTCPSCKTPIREVAGSHVNIFPVEKCRKCNFKYTDFPPTLLDDEEAVLIQEHMLKILYNMENFITNNGNSLSPPVFFQALKTIYKLVFKIAESDGFLELTKNRNNLFTKEILCRKEHALNMRFYIHGYTTLRADYVFLTTAYLMLKNWPSQFYLLLNSLVETYRKRNKKTLPLVGLGLSVHEKLKCHHIHFIQSTYLEWLKKRLAHKRDSLECRISCAYVYGKKLSYQIDKKMVTKAINKFTKKYLNEIIDFVCPCNKQLYPQNYRSAVAGARKFFAAYAYRLITGCTWYQVPVAKQNKLVASRLSKYLNRKKYLKLPSKRLIISLGRNLAQKGEFPLELPDQEWHAINKFLQLKPENFRLSFFCNMKRSRMVSTIVAKTILMRYMAGIYLYNVPDIKKKKRGWRMISRKIQEMRKRGELSVILDRFRNFCSINYPEIYKATIN